LARRRKLLCHRRLKRTWHWPAVSKASIHFEDQIAAGDKVVSRFIVHATHDRGELMGLAPSGRELVYMPIGIHRIEGARSPRSGEGARASPN